jgi:DNA-binding LacI/PurR family transcriptional regulator
VGFDDIFLSALMDPPLTTVRYPIVEMGVAAIEKLLISLGTETAPLEPSIGELRHELMIRGSTAPPNS